VLDVTDIRFMKVVSSRSEYTVEKVSDGRYIVRKGPNVYFVGFEKADIIRGSCNCPDWKFHSRKMKVPCKHIWLVAEFEGRVSFPSAGPLPPGDHEGPPDKDPEVDNRKGPMEVEEIDIPLD